MSGGCWFCSISTAKDEETAADGGETSNPLSLISNMFPSSQPPPRVQAKFIDSNRSTASTTASSSLFPVHAALQQATSSSALRPDKVPQLDLKNIDLYRSCNKKSQNAAQNGK
mmetsp:Transcript_58216/g.155548  ORF Transcript_58216/g.155548 Transcript_58216/m.155548 type:complete len:113 (+) Transcript_58216:59-397(+)